MESKKYTINSNYSDIDKKAWTDFVYNHPQGNIFQTVEMYEIYKKTPKYEPYIFVALNEEGTIKGLLSAVIQKEFKGVMGTFTARSIVIGGPLVENDEEEIAAQLLEKYNQTINRKAIYSQFRNIFDLTSLNNAFEKLQYIKEEHLDIHVDLTKPEDELWKDVHTKRRNEIRKAEKEGLTVREVTSEEDRNIVYKILKEVYSRAKLPLASCLFFDNAYEELSKQKMIKFYAAFKEEVLIGTMIILCYKKEMYDWYAGSFMAYYKKGPNNILPWRIFQDAKSEGFIKFDFGGAGKPDKPYGVREYKKKFGGEFVNYGRYEFIHKPLIYALVSRLFIWSQKLRKLI